MILEWRWQQSSSNQPKRNGKSERRDCESCVAYYNLPRGGGYRCGLGFQIAEELESDDTQRWRLCVHPYQNECAAISPPKTKEEFVATAKELEIDWDIDEVPDLGESIFE